MPFHFVSNYVYPLFLLWSLLTPFYLFTLLPFYFLKEVSGRSTGDGDSQSLQTEMAIALGIRQLIDMLE